MGDKTKKRMKVQMEKGRRNERTDKGTKEERKKGKEETHEGRVNEKEDKGTGGTES